MTTEELRAMTAQGPVVVQVERLHLLRLIDDREEAIAEANAERRRANGLAIILIGALSILTWQIVFFLLEMAGVV
jgi:hypothetical protein